MTCAKRTYRSASHVRRAHRAAKWRVRAYYCAECNGWHATNQEKR